MGDGSPAWKQVSGYLWLSNQYQPGSCQISLRPLSSPSLDQPRHRAGTGSVTSGLLPIEIPVLCLAAAHGLLYGVSF